MRSACLAQVHDKQDLPRAVVVNSLDHRYVAVASMFGIREVDVVSVLEGLPRPEHGP